MLSGCRTGSLTAKQNRKNLYSHYLANKEGIEYLARGEDEAE
jgi:hypothetical protein